jgi:DNA-binding CsgD family transcriptional regulator
MVVDDTLVGSALVAAAWGQPELAARWLGAEEALRDHVQIGVDLLSGLAMHERLRSTLWATLGEQGLQAGRLAGRDLSLATVVSEIAALQPPTAVPDAVPDIPASSTIRLSPREEDVLRLLIDGQSDRQIAETLFISLRTAEGHVARLLAKLGVSTRSAAVAAAVAARLVAPRIARSPSRD